MLKRSLLPGALTFLLLGGLAQAQQAPPQPSPVKRTPLGKVEVPGSNYKVGESLQLPDRAIHNEGAAGANPVKVFAVFVVEKGQPLVQPAQPPH